MRRDEILRALTALGAELAERGLVADLYVVGGAAITLAYERSRCLCSPPHTSLIVVWED